MSQLSLWLIVSFSSITLKIIEGIPKHFRHHLLNCYLSGEVEVYEMFNKLGIVVV